MSIILFRAVYSFAPPPPSRQSLPPTFSSVSYRARLAAEETPLGLCFSGPRGAKITVRVGLSAEGELRLPTHEDTLRWSGKELGYPLRRTFVREVSVRKLSVPGCLGWWLVRSHQTLTPPLVLLLERPPSVVLLDSAAFTRDLVALRIDGAGAAGSPKSGGFLFDCERHKAALRHTRAISLAGRSHLYFRCLPALTQLPALHVLTLALPDFNGLEWVGRCKALRVFQLAGCLVRSSLSPLEALRGLRVVLLEACDLRDFAPLAALTELRVLQVSFSSFLRNLDVAARLPRLEVLQISDCVQLANVDGLRAASRLRWVSFQGIAVANFDALNALPLLQRLECVRCSNLRWLSALCSAPHLYEVDLSRSGLVHLDGLLKCESLRRVVAGQCSNLVSIAGLRCAAELLELDIHGTPVQSLLPLAGAVQLRRLIVHHTSISDFDGVEHCKGLEIVDAHGCQQLISVCALRKLRHLTFVDVRGCPFIRDFDTLKTRSSQVPPAAVVLRSG